jgi:signal transduction histidine kinase
MMRAFPRNHLPACGIFILAMSAMSPRLEAAAAAQVTNPIARIARVFDPKLVKVEDRLTWLGTQISSYAVHCEHPLKVGLGYRGGRIRPGDPDPLITLDLGANYPLENIFLVPAQREFTGDSGIFPKRFSIEVSATEDFAQRTLVYTTGRIPHPSPDGIPVQFVANAEGRYVKLTVHEGHNKGSNDLFGLSEVVVISKDGVPVSLGARVQTVGSLNVPGIWCPAALVDGRTPLGIWQNGEKPGLDPGDAVMVASPDEITIWTVHLDAPAALDRLILFPFQVNRSFEASVFPDAFSVHLLDPAGEEEVEVYQWSNPLLGSSHMTPMVIPLGGRTARSVQIRASRAWTMGDRNLHALSEIEVWSGGHNLALGQGAFRESAGITTPVSALTDGFSSEKRIIPIGVWLQQLNERGRVERELMDLRSIQRQLASRSELNATWGSAVILGLTFLIPVFIVERRRLMSRDQLDQIRKRIASDLHDDIGSNLGSISLIARTARKDLARLHGPEEIAEDLSEVETIARESSLAMRDIVWLLERRQDSIGDLFQRMNETAERLLREIRYTLECESTKTAAKLSLDAKRHLFLFYKEAIHNVLKHSQADQVSIRLMDVDDKLALEILDNGVGIPLDHDQQPTTVHKLEDRARVLEGILQIATSKDSGTCVRLLVKRSNLTHQPSLS